MQTAVVYSPKFLMMQAESTAMWRFYTDRADGRDDVRCVNNYREDDATKRMRARNGMRGEAAFHVWQWDVYWLRYARWNFAGRAEFAGFIDVKAIQNPNYSLQVYDPLELDWAYVLAYEDRTSNSRGDLTRFELRGWLFGRDLQKIPIENRCREYYRQAHYAKRLRPMSSLLGLMRERGAPVVEDRYGLEHIEFMRNGGFRLGSR